MGRGRASRLSIDANIGRTVPIFFNSLLAQSKLSLKQEYSAQMRHLFAVCPISSVAYYQNNRVKNYTPDQREYLDQRVKKVSTELAAQS
jgi:hypothetical protein